MKFDKKTPFNVLIVEDDDSEIYIIEKILKDYEKKICLMNLTDGDSAIKHLKRLGDNDKEVFLPNLILLDLNLPKKDGFEVLEVKSNISTLKNIPVVVLTSSDYEKDVIRAYGLGANAYTVKPLSYKAYKKLIISILDFWINYIALQSVDN